MKKISQTQKLVENSVNIVHRFARELRPTVLDDLGLIPALESFIKEFTRRTGISVHFTALRRCGAARWGRNGRCSIAWPNRRSPTSTGMRTPAK